MSDCILWQHSVRDDGYGQKCLWINGKQKNVRAHRWIWEQAHGPIPDGLRVLHKCDVPLCINLEHLELGTQKKNLEQMYERGRGRKRSGSTHPRAKLDADKVREIRQLSAEGMPKAKIAEKFGIVPSGISSVLNGGTWAHVQ